MYLDGELYTLLEGVTGALIDGLDTLDIDRGDDEVVLREDELLADILVCIETEDGRANDLSGVLVEIVELCSCDRTTDTRGDGFRGVTDEIRNGEEFSRFLLVLDITSFEVPV